jgi:hypothetical protein
MQCPEILLKINLNDPDPAVGAGLPSGGVYGIKAGLLSGLSRPAKHESTHVPAHAAGCLTGCGLSVGLLSWGTWKPNPEFGETTWQM